MRISVASWWQNLRTFLIQKRLPSPSSLFSVSFIYWDFKVNNVVNILAVSWQRWRTRPLLLRRVAWWISHRLVFSFNFLWLSRSAYHSSPLGNAWHFISPISKGDQRGGEALLCNIKLFLHRILRLRGKLIMRVDLSTVSYGAMKQCWGSGPGRIRTFLVGSGSGYWP
jgi:hypothetical protein